jgi:serine/threonine protein phosphatase 1
MKCKVVVPENDIGEDYVVGDIHGCYADLQECLETVRFNPDVDRLFSVGDIIDRGPDSFKCLSLLDEPWFYAVRGNHEQRMLDALRYVNPITLELDYSTGYNAGVIMKNWEINGGDWYRKLSISHQISVLSYFRDKVVGLPYLIQIPYHGFKIGLIHAEFKGNWWELTEEAIKVNPNIRAEILWGRTYAQMKTGASGIKDCGGVDVLIAGHTPRYSPFWRGNRLFIDTGAGKGGNLTLVSLKWLTTGLACGTLPPIQ